MEKKFLDVRKFTPSRGTYPRKMSLSQRRGLEIRLMVGGMGWIHHLAALNNQEQTGKKWDHAGDREKATTRIFRERSVLG